MFKKSLQLLLVICTTGLSLKAQCPAAGIYAGADITVCAGSIATHAATLPTGFTGTWSRLNFWDQGTITSPASPTSTVTALNTAGTISEIWTITDGASCTGIRDTVKIIILNAQTPANAGTDKTICLGETVTLGATAASSGSTGLWSKLNGTNSSTSVITNPTSRISTVTGLNIAGIDTLKWTVSNAACSSTDVMVISTNNIPSVAIAGSDVTGCVGDTVTLYGSIATSGSPIWSRAGVNGSNTNNIRFVPNANNDTVKVALRVAGIYTMYYTISVGATNLNSPCTKRDSLTITIKPALSVNAGIDQLSCDGSITTFTVLGNKPTIGTGEWFIVGSGIGSVTTTLDTVGTVTGLSAGINTLGWQVTDGVCTATDYMTIAVGPPPTAVAGNNVTGCVGDTIKLFGSIAHFGIPAWSRAGVTFFNTNNIRFVPNANNDTVLIALNVAGTYKLYYTISLGATGLASNCFSRDSLTVIVNSGPTVALISGPSTLSSCSTVASFTLNANTPATGETGVWLISSSGQGTLTPISAISTKVSGLPQGTTTVVWRITGTNGCVSSAKINIAIGAGAGPDRTACVGDTTFQISGSTAPGWTHLWSTQGSTIAHIVGNQTAANVTLSITGAGTVHMLYTIIDAGTSCVSTDTMTLTTSVCISTGIVNNEKENLTLLVYPNPTDGIFFVVLKDTKPGYAEITILTLDGRIVLLEQLGAVKDIQKEINLSNVAKGIYFIRVRKGEETSFAKLIVQ